MPKKSFKIKIIIPTVIVLVAMVVALNVFLSMRFSALSDDLINEKLIANINSLNLYLDNSKAASRAAAVSMAVNSGTVKAVKERNTSELLRLFSPTHDLYHINYYTICDNEGIVLARTHAPEHFGDSVLGQQNIRDALTGKISAYFEEGTDVKVSVRTGSPVYDANGVLIGAISAGVRFDLDGSVAELKKLFNAEVAIFYGDTIISTTITKDGRSIAGTKLDPDIAKIVLEDRREYTGAAKVFGEKYNAFYKPLLNAQNEAFATFFLGTTEARIIEASNKSIRYGIIFGFCGLAVSITVIFFIISSISKPVTSLSDDMDRIANGNLNININIKDGDEIGRLAGSFQKVANIIRKLLEEITIMIAEHEKGNTDYSLNADEFQGDYKTLALSISKFAAFGLTDNLTGIPNRRNFDNRLNFEWKRAINEETPISVLIIDVDKLKNYNDSFGHQQGDLALQTVAKTIKQSARPLIDFVARWHSDEIAVLLPATDSTGAMRIAEKIRMEIEKALVPCTELKGLNVTVSIGVNTQIPAPGKSMDGFISLADSALYKAKEAGRNRVVLGKEDS